MLFFFNDRNSGQTYWGDKLQYVGLAANGGRPAVGCGVDLEEPVRAAPARWAEDAQVFGDEHFHYLVSQAETAGFKPTTVSVVIKAYAHAAIHAAANMGDFAECGRLAALHEKAANHADFHSHFRPEVGKSLIQSALEAVGLG